MSKSLLSLTIALLTVGPLQAQAWREQLGQDLVTVEEGKMVFEEVGLVKIELAGYEPSRIPVKLYSEAPHGGLISRDNFVSLSSSYLTVILMESLAQAYQVTAAEFLEAFDYTELQEVIGTPGMEFNFFMTNEGLQFEIVNNATGERMRHAMTWAEVYGT